MDARRRQRWKTELRRRRSRPAAAAGDAQAVQTAADQRRARQRERTRRRTLAVGLFSLAIGLAVSHLLEHAGVFQVMSPGLQDLLIGYPAAGVLAIAGGIVLGR